MFGKTFPVSGIATIFKLLFNTFKVTRKMKMPFLK
jgi:hypothetical protein